MQENVGMGAPMIVRCLAQIWCSLVHSPQRTICSLSPWKMLDLLNLLRH